MVCVGHIPVCDIIDRVQLTIKSQRLKQIRFRDYGLNGLFVAHHLYALCKYNSYDLEEISCHIARRQFSTEMCSLIVACCTIVMRPVSVASLGLVSLGVATDGVTLYFVEKN